MTIERPSIFDDIEVGSSISVAGACLTIVRLTPDFMEFDVHEETWKRTNLGTLEKGDSVNLERAMKAGCRLEGHIVQGHVDCVGEVKHFSRVSAGGASRETYLTILYPPSLRGLIVEKGSIAIDGASLTVASVDDENFSVALIPETLRKTTLGSLKEGSTVNVEADILGKYARA